MRGIVKQFPGVRALDGVDLDVRAGEVHCLLGQNGAGKSTLIKVLAGVHQPDEGTIEFNGEQVRPSSPNDAIRLGFATIYQELDLVDGLSVAENIFLGHEHARARLRQQGGGQPRPPARCWRGSATGRSARPPRWGGCPPAAKQVVVDGPGALPRRPPDHHGRAVGRAGPRRGGQPVPDHPRAHRAGRGRRLHLPPAGGDPRDRRPGHRAEGRPYRRRRPARPGHRRPRRSSR